MIVYLGYALRETVANLWRNKVMTIAAVLTVIISLGLFGAFLGMRQITAQVEDIWQRETNVTIFMNASASSAQIGAVKNELRALPYIAGTCTYEGKAENYQEALRLIGPGDMERTPVSDWVSSFVCVPKQAIDVSLIVNQFQGAPGVYRAVAPVQEVKTQERILNVASLLSLIIGLVLLGSAAVLIWNTIRLAIFSRRREISVMKLVGATNWFIRVPYISEGFIQGFLGGAGAVIVLILLRAFLPLHYEWQLSTGDMVGTCAVVLIVGALIGAVGSTLAIRKFLDV